MADKRKPLPEYTIDDTGLLGGINSLLAGGAKPRAALKGLLGGDTTVLKGLLGELKQLGDPNYMRQVKGIGTDEAMNIALDANPVMAAVTGYRGLTQPFDGNIKNSVEWFSETPELANVYSGNGIGSNIIKKELGDVNKNAVDLGFRDYMTEVKKSDVLDRIEKRVIDAFNSGKINKETGLLHLDEIDKLRINENEFKRVHDWIASERQIPNILKKSGYDAISHVENGHQTYGVLGGAK